MLLTDKEARSITDRLLGYTKADDALVSVTSETYSHQRFAANAFTTTGRRENLSVNVTVWIDKRRGAAAANDTDDAALRATVEQAEQIARISPVDKEYLPTLSAQTYKPTNGFAEATANISAAERARGVGDIIRSCEKAGVTGAGFHQARGTATASATRHGNFGYERSSLVSLAMTARTPDGTASGYFSRNHFDAARLDTAHIAREAIRKALDARNPRTLEPGVYPVILEAQAVADLLSFFSFGFDARGADEGRNAFAAPAGKTKMGERIFDERLNVYSDPWRAELPGSQAAQAGLPAQKIYLVRGGTLENLIYSRYWAQQKGKEPTPGPVNNIVESAAPPTPLSEMIGTMKRGLLVSRFWYIRTVDPRTLLVTGLTRDGIWYVEDGVIKYPVRNFRFNQSLMQMLAPGNVELIGAPERVSSSEGQGSNSSLLPALRLKAFNFTSQSEAV